MYIVLPKTCCSYNCNIKGCCQTPVECTTHTPIHGWKREGERGWRKRETQKGGTLRIPFHLEEHTAQHTRGPFCCVYDDKISTAYTHTFSLTQVSMAHKVLSSDMSHLVEAMKNAQKHYQTFLEQEYRKQMFHAAHIVAVNSKQLMDAVNSARRKARLMQR